MLKLKPDLLALTMTVLLSGTSTVVSARSDECIFAFTSQIGTPAFEAFPADNLVHRLKPPSTIDAEARRYRTAISTGATAEVNFAGRYTIVGWGCGSSCLDWAIIDRVTGAVHFDARYRIVTTLHVADRPVGPELEVDRTFNGLRFRRDSNLLVIQGAPNEDERQEGLTFLEWSGHEFRRVAFVPASQLCS